MNQFQSISENVQAHRLYEHISKIVGNFTSEIRAQRPLWKAELAYLRHTRASLRSTAQLIFVKKIRHDPGVQLPYAPPNVWI